MITTDNTEVTKKELSIDPRVIHAECFGLSLRRAARATARRYDEALRPIDLTLGQFGTLVMLAELQAVSMHALAELLTMDRTTLTAALKPLQRRALVAVRPDKSDRRSRNVTLTDRGVTLLRSAIPLWKKVQGRIGLEMGTAGLPIFRAQLVLLSAARDAESSPESS